MKNHILFLIFILFLPSFYKNNDKVHLGKNFYLISNTLSKDVDNSIQCNKWIISEDDLSGILKKFKEVSSEEFFAKCYHTNCFYKSKAKNYSDTFDLYINSASYIVLSNDHITYYFISEVESELFIMPCDCCED